MIFCQVPSVPVNATGPITTAPSSRIFGEVCVVYPGKEFFMPQQFLFPGFAVNGHDLHEIFEKIPGQTNPCLHNGASNQWDFQLRLHGH